MIYQYRRVSTDEQHNGPEAQRDAIARWLAAQPTAQVVDVFDQGVSGSIPLGIRPEASKMIGGLRSGDTVVVSRLDRLFRSVADAANTIEAWNQLGVRLVALAEGFDMTNPYGRAMAQMASVFAELERAMIRQRTRDAMASRKQRGLTVGPTPYGWNREGEQLIENPVEQLTIKQIRTWYSIGLTERRIANKLNRLGVPPKRSRAWHHSSIASILRIPRAGR